MKNKVSIEDGIIDVYKYFDDKKFRLPEDITDLPPDDLRACHKYWGENYVFCMNKLSFMQAKINNDTAEMRRYLTAAFEKSFDPEAEKGDFDPVDFKITRTTPRDSTYIIVGEETDRSWEGESFKTRYEFTVIKESGSWLIDRRKNLP